MKHTLSLVLVLALSLTGCASTSEPRAQEISSSAQRAMLPDGTYQVQNANYEDASGKYEVFILNPPAGSRPVLETDKLAMARLDDAAVSQGKKSYLEVKGGQPTLYLTPSFQIAYTHNVTENKTNPSTGQTETVIVRQESSFWTPFLASMAGTAIANSLFTPNYYMPPVYSPGGLRGYGGYGSTPELASRSYQNRYGTLPPASRFSQSGNVFGRSNSRRESLRSSGSGAGASRFNSSSSSRSRSMGKSFGSGRRR